uniref:BTB domain-containing protein n=1 Tax=Homalodisca liturata TaxID=320908 RepID=A0A1B6HGR6_9HEMI
MATSQRFCLRWNNHQSNLLSVFDQLLHDEAFVDVTLAVEGQFLRAHKMVLSACSPYFQSLFVGHPDRHPIVILKDVPYADMRSLLDFMYRGEVSVDQERLTAFLKVAESLRIKGLTEVNEERCDLPSIASSLLSTPPSAPPPPNLHRIHPLSHKRVLPPMAANPLLGSALTAPKRKRGRPRKLSGSSNGPNTPGEEDNTEQEMRLHHPNRADSPAMVGPPDLLEVNMGDSDHNPLQNDESGMEADDTDGKLDNSEAEEIEEKPIKQEPTPGTSSHDSSFKGSNSQDGDTFNPEVGMLRLVPHSELMPKNVDGEEGLGSSEGGASGEASIIEEGDNENNNESFIEEVKNSIGEMEGEQGPFGVGPCFSEPPPARPAPTRRRIRRRATSSSDPAEQLTEMSVRGLNLFRYASVSEGVYKCMECEKADILKTFKNKYSFQRHAFLYHEGHHRKVFPCPVCSKEFSRPDKMKNHMKTVHDCFMPKDCVFPPAVGFFLPP